MRIIQCDENQKKRIQEVNLYPEHCIGSLDDEYVNCFVRCLEIDRATNYQFLSKPDSSNRNAPQPDYLYRKNGNGTLIAIEYTRIFESEKEQKRLSYTIEQYNQRGIIPWQWIKKPIPKELGRRLNEFLLKKLSKGQLNSITNAERILLCRNWWTGAEPAHFFSAKPFIECNSLRKYCDHIYVILHARSFTILEIF
jgi:hypothetical protein